MKIIRFVQYKTVIICTGNICRSPMAEGILGHMLPGALKERISVQSAGTHAYDGLDAEPFAVRTLLDRDIDIRSHRSKRVDDTMLANADLILAMEDAHLVHAQRMLPAAADRMHLLGEFDIQQSGEEVPDPYGGTLETYQQCAQTISAYLEGVIDHLHNAIGGNQD